MFDHKEGSIGIILSQILGLKDHKFPFYKVLSDGMLGSRANFLALSQK